MADIFTKPFGLDKLWQFSSALGVQYLDMSNLRGRNERGRDGQNEMRNQAEKEDVQEAELDTEFDFGPTKEVRMHRSAEEAEDGWTCVDRTDKWRLFR